MTQPNPQFATTQWTLVWKAAEEDSQHGRPALEEVIRRYWHPLYSFARRRGMSSEDAEDATQEFLSGVISGHLLENANPAKGRFRSFLLTAWKRFLVDQYRKRQTVRQGGAVDIVSLNFKAGEQRWREIQSKEPDPDRLFMISWADSLLGEVRERLRTDYARREKENVFDALMPRLTETLSGKQYATLGQEIGLSASAIKVALHRLRQRFGETLRAVVLETIDDPSELDAEIHELLGVLTESR